jgi:ribonuclease P protein component
MERRHRIRRDRDFRRVRQQGRCWSSDILVVCALRGEAAETRFGFVVGKRLGDAVVRNRIKRRLREAARRLAPNLLPGYDIVVIARGPIAARTAAELGEALAGLARRARLRRTSAGPAAPHEPAAGAAMENTVGSVAQETAEGRQP